MIDPERPQVDLASIAISIREMSENLQNAIYGIARCRSLADEGPYPYVPPEVDEILIDMGADEKTYDPIFTFSWHRDDFERANKYAANEATFYEVGNFIPAQSSHELAIRVRDNFLEAIFYNSPSVICMYAQTRAEARVMFEECLNDADRRELWHSIMTFPEFDYDELVIQLQREIALFFPTITEGRRIVSRKMVAKAIHVAEIEKELSDTWGTPIVRKSIGAGRPTNFWDLDIVTRSLREHRAGKVTEGELAELKDISVPYS